MINLYIADVSCLKDSEIFEKKYNSLPDIRREKVDRVRFNSDKSLELGAGLLLKYALSMQNLDINDLVFSKNKYGKPYLKDYSDLHFSLSHSRERVMCAVSDKEIGCDIQYTDETNANILNIAKRFFTGKEYAALLKICEDKTKVNDLFYSIWVLKESCIKACGQGLAKPLNSFESMPDTRGLFLPFGEEKKDYYCNLKSFSLSGPYKCAVAAISEDIPEILTEVDLSL